MTSEIGAPVALQIGTNQFSGQPGDFEQVTKNVLNKLEDWNLISSRELNECENEIMNCITELRESRTVLSAVVSSSDAENENLKAAISKHVIFIEKILEALNTLWNRHLGIKQNTTLSRIGYGDIRKLIGEFLRHQKAIQLNFEQRIHEPTIG